MTLGTVILDIGGGLIALGGMYDILMPDLPANLRARCGEAALARGLVRDLLRALGGCLVAIGVSVVLLANVAAKSHATWPLWLILVLVGPSEGFNILGMFRSGSPYLVPAAFVALVIVGVCAALVHSV